MSAALLLGFLGPESVSFQPGWQGALVLIFLGVFVLGGVIFPIALGLALGRRFGRTLVGGLAGLAVPILAVVGFVASAVNDAASPEALAAYGNERVAAAAERVQAGVVGYAADHGGRPPTRAELVAAKRPDGTPYLDLAGVDAPPAALTAPNGELVGVASRAKGQPYTTVGTTAMEGREPVDGKYDHRTFGAIAYDADPAGKRWVVYGLGQLGAMISVERALHEPGTP